MIPALINFQSYLVVGIVVGIVGVPLPGIAGVPGTLPAGGIPVLPGFGVIPPLGFILSGLATFGFVGLVGIDPPDGIASDDGVVASGVDFWGLVTPVVRLLTFFLRALLMTAAVVDTCEEVW